MVPVVVCGTLMMSFVTYFLGGIKPKKHPSFSVAIWMDLHHFCYNESVFSFDDISTSVFRHWLIFPFRICDKICGKNKVCERIKLYVKEQHLHMLQGEK